MMTMAFYSVLAKMFTLMSPSLLVVDIFANDSPVLHPEYLFSKYLVGVDQAIENKPTE